MFDFLKNIDYILIKILNDIENSITIKNGYTLATIQSYCEILLKYVNQQEKIIDQRKIALGEFLTNQKFNRWTVLYRVDDIIEPSSPMF